MKMNLQSDNPGNHVARAIGIAERALDGIRNLPEGTQMTKRFADLELLAEGMIDAHAPIEPRPVSPEYRKRIAAAIAGGYS